MQTKLEFTHCFFTCDPFKFSEVERMNKFMSICKIGEEVHFEGFGNISFDESDTQNRYPTITWDEEYLKEYSRKHCNCLVYNLDESYRNDGEWDKLFIYQTKRTNNVVWYGYVAYNTKTGKHSHRFFIEPEYDELFVNISNFLNSIKKYRRYVERAAERRNK